MLVLQRISRAYLLTVFDCMQVCQMDGRTGPNQSAASTYSGAVQSGSTLSHLRMNIPVEVHTMLQFYTNCKYFKHRKFPKYLDTQNICCNHSKIWTMLHYHRVMSPYDADGMANHVDPDQTAPLGAVWSGSALFAQAYLSENLGSLPNKIVWVWMLSD